MNWIKENKFLSGFFAVMLVGVGVLGYLLWTASSRYRDASAQYEDQATELNRLKSLAPYPAAPNVEKIEAQRKEHQASVLALQKSLAGMEIPIEQITEVQFQDRLRETVSRVTAKANERQMALPEKFYMGFAQYETQPPRAEAAPLLGRELKAIEVVMMQLIESNVSRLTKLDRPELTEEKEPRTSSSSGSTSGSGKGSAHDEGHENDLVKKESFDIAFVADQLAFNNAVNSIVANKTQFYIPRVIEVKNEKTKSPSKTEAPGTTADAAAPTPAIDAPAAAGAVPAAPGAVPAAPRAPAPPGAPAAAPAPAAPPPLPGAAATGSQESYTLIFGAEKLEVGMRIELIDFTPPPEAKPAR
jgi:hypothetical protein